MQFKNLVFLGLASFAIAQNDSDCDSPDSSNDDGGNNCSTTTDVNGVILTTRVTTSDVGLSTTYVPVTTAEVATTTDVGVSTGRQTLK